MNEVSKINAVPGGTPPPISQRDYLALRVALSASIEIGLVRELPADRAPSAEIRHALQARAVALADCLRPAGVARAQQEVAALIGLRPIRGDATDLRAVLAIYGADLADLPLFALSAACADFRQGRAGDGEWAPTQAQIRVQALKHLQPIAKERREIEAVLTARIQGAVASPERRAQVNAHVAETRRQLGAFSAQAEAEDRATKAARHKYWGPEPAPAAPIDHSTPVKLSADCRSTLGLSPLPIEDARPHEEHQDA